MSVMRNTSNRVITWQSGPWARPRHPASAVLMAAIAILMVLSGCAPAEEYDHYAIFDREPELADAPPPELADQAPSGIDIDSLRFATEYEGDHLYLAMPSDSAKGICLLVDSPEATGVTAACSGGPWVDSVVGATEYHVHSDAALPPAGYEDIAENIAVRMATG